MSDKYSRRRDSPLVKLSKSLSYVLRHGAQKEGLNIRADGYVNLHELMRLPRFKGRTLDEIQQVVKENDKQRFALIQQTTENGDIVWWIRANQGHSLEVEELELEKITNPSQIPQVIHGTYSSKWKIIETQGLSKMNRTHIHFATGKWGDQNVKSGMRANCDVYIYINVYEAMKDGIEFYRSSNGVILTKGDKGTLDKRYFLKVVDRNEKILYGQSDSVILTL
ncbi:2193_t:CDS:2 [Funneliformis caledonium]|uniref:2'-phosphotransferase n=1 Tax=Funneliformis caledonium TaxID=1117310 RepID=A0A9N8ZZN8_9GLOM|nr:2193_t:CDS:2 [Funneliformis caledonium]